MKNKSAIAPTDLPESDIREYAFHLYEQSGRIPGRDLDNWLEAKACLQANVAKPDIHQRLHRHLNPVTAGATRMPASTSSSREPQQVAN